MGDEQAAPTAEHDGCGGWVERWRYWLGGGLLLLALAGVVAYAFPVRWIVTFPKPGPGPYDASGLMGTIVTIYAALIGGYLALAGALAASGPQHGKRFKAKWIAIGTTVMALLFNLYRLVPTSVDLYGVTMHSLTQPQMLQETSEFVRDFIANMVVILPVAGVLVWLSSTKTSTNAPAERERGGRGQGPRS